MLGNPYTKRLIFLLLFLAMNSVLSIVPVGCQNETPVYAIVGQQLAIIRQGRYDSVLFELKFELRQIGVAYRPTEYRSGHELYATSPAPPIIRNQISKISITSNEPYDKTHGSFSELNGLFALHDNPGIPISNLPPPIVLDDRRAVYILPIQPPTSGNLFRLTAMTTLEDGTILTASTNIEINP